MIPTSPQKWAAYTSSTAGERFLSALRLLLPWLARHRRRLASAVLLAVITVLAGFGLFSVAGLFLTGRSWPEPPSLSLCSRLRRSCASCRFSVFALAIPSVSPDMPLPRHCSPHSDLPSSASERCVGK